MSLIDADVADITETWGPLSDTKLEQAIDALVDKQDTHRPASGSRKPPVD